MKAYIISTSAITPQQTFDKDGYLKEWVEHDGTYLKAVEPAYRGHIDPKLLRRMSRIIKMGVASAKDALAQANVENPDAIIVGTGLGCIEDTEKFLKNIVESEEGILSPTAFIQSTHNTIAGQIALLIQCPNYNFTYTNRGHSFENALIDTCVQLTEGKDNILLGAAEEVTDQVFDIMNQIGCVGDQSNSRPTLGEGAAFFVISKSGSENTPYLADVTTFNNANSYLVTNKIDDILSKNGLSSNDVDLLLLGNTNKTLDQYYNSAVSCFDANIPQIAFKKISGEHFTASAHAMHLAAIILKEQKSFNKELIDLSFSKPVKNILIYNHYNEVNHTVMLLSIR